MHMAVDITILSEETKALGARDHAIKDLRGDMKEELTTLQGEITEFI